jgi:endonuclease/exonuclease/phosphatase family metal-dependent hydrolase
MDKYQSFGGNMNKLDIIVVAGLLAVSSQAALVWTGGGDKISLYQEANWQDDTGSVPANNTINSAADVSADTGTEKLIEISSGTGTPSAAGGYFKIGNNSLTVSGGKTLNMTATGSNNGCVISTWTGSDQVLTVSDGATVSGVDLRNFTTVNVDGGTIALTGTFSGANSGLTQGISISNGGSVTAASFGLIYDEAITVDGSSSLTVTTATTVPFAKVELERGAKLTLSSVEYFTTYGSSIYVDGVSYAEDSSILSFAGTTAFAGADAPAPELSIITYNIHGGYGPDDEGTPESNLIAFRDNFMNDEDVLCFQEVDGDFTGDCWDVIPDIFTNYPYRFRTINQETDYSWWESPKETSIVILSKYPFLTTDSELVQTDPTYDKWERHAQHVTIQMGEDVVDIFHFHNTYNFNDNDWEYEKSGLVKFRDYVYSELNISSLDEAENLIMLGDFNLLYTNVETILDTPERKYDGRDHICSVPYFTSEGKYATVTADLSDHPALWASLDMQAPAPDPLTWATAPEATGTDSIYMVATNAVDFNGVEYYFANTSVTDGSHDSGWQNSPSYTDTGLSEATTYSYTVQTRDKSVNANTSGSSSELSATTDTENEAPTANDVQISRDEGESCKVHESQLLAACTDPNGRELGVSAVDGVSAGGQSVSVSNSWIFYTPADDYDLGDSFGYSITNSLGASSSAQVIVTLEGMTEADSISLDIVPDTEGNASLTLHGIPGRAVVIEKTTNLVDGVWTSIQTNTFSVTGEIDFEESNIPDQQYYRMRLH